MRKLVKFIAAACAAAIFTGSVSAVSFASGTGTKSVAIAAQEGTKSVKVTTVETMPFDGVVIYAVYEGQTLSSIEAKTFKDISSEKEGEVQFDKAYTKTNSKLFVWSSLSEMIPYNVTVTPEKVQINTVAKVEISGDATAPATLNATVSAINDSEFEDTSAFIYEWKKGEEILSETGSILEDAAEGNYTVTATYTGTGNYEGSITTASPYIVSPQGDTREDITGDDTISVSINASSQTAPSNLTAQISSGEKALAAEDFTYFWSRNGSPISGGENGTLENVQAGDYTVVAAVKSDNTSYKGSTAASVAVTVKAVYTVTWSVDGNTTQETYTESETPSYSGTPSKAQTNTDTYVFTGWTPEITAVTADITYTAQFSPSKRSYNVTYNANEGTIANESNYTSYTCGTALTLPIPTRSGYTFVGWYEKSDFSGSKVAAIDTDAYSDKEYFAKWEANEPGKFTITWKNDDGSTIKTTQATNGETPVFDGNTPTKADTAKYTYTFAGWTPAVAAATADAEYTATFTPTTRSYKITWVVEGKANKEENVEYGVTPEYVETPTREATAEHTYTFKEWSPEIVAVTGEQTYTATWNEIKNKYTITWKDGDNTLKTEQVAYGETPSYSGTALIKEGYSYTWTPEITEVTGDATYTTNWTINKYTVTNNSAADDGTKHGTITLSGLDDNGKAEYNNIITVTPAADAGYELKKITVNDTDITEPVDDAWQFTIPASDVEVTAIFEKKAVKSINVDGAQRVQKGKTANYTAKVIAEDDTDVTSVYASDIVWSVDETSQTAGTAIENGTLAVNKAQTADVTVKAAIGDTNGTAVVVPTTQRPDALDIVSAEASHAENGSNVVANTIDGDTSTYCSINVNSGRKQNYMTYNLGETKKSITSVEIYFRNGNERVYDFDIKVSSDGVYWENAGSFKSSGNTDGFERFEIDTRNARYVRYDGRGSDAVSGDNNVSYNEICEFEVYGSDELVQEPGKLEVSSAEASAAQNEHPAENVIDSDNTTDWRALVADASKGNTLTLDLGAKKRVSAVELLFFEPHNRSHKFNILVSSDGENWKMVKSYPDGIGHTINTGAITGERITFDAVNAQYIRYVGFGSFRVDGTGIEYNCICEFNVYGDDNLLTEPTQQELTLVRANAQQDGNEAAKAIDKNEETRWAANISSAMLENTITFDLGKEKCISASEIYFNSGNSREYDFDIWVSNDSNMWTKAGTYTSSKKPKYERFEFDPVNARYIQYSGRGATESNGNKNVYNSFFEFRVYGFDDKDESVQDAPTASLINLDALYRDNSITWNSFDGASYYVVEHQKYGIALSVSEKISAAENQNEYTYTAPDSGDYGYVVKGYTAAGELIAQSEPVGKTEADTKTVYYAQTIMESETTFNRVDIDWGGNDAPEDYMVVSSSDGVVWKKMGSNSPDENSISNFSFDNGSFYTYKSYTARYVRVISETDISSATISVSNKTDVSPTGSAMQFVKNDGTDIKETATDEQNRKTEHVNDRLNVKTVWASSYIYWNKNSEKSRDLEEVNIIIPLGAKTNISSIEIGSYYNVNNNNGIFNSYMAGNYQLSYISAEENVKVNSDWHPLESGAGKGRLITDFANSVQATHIKLTLSGNITGTNGGYMATFLSYIGIYTSDDIASTPERGSYEIKAI